MQGRRTECVIGEFGRDPLLECVCAGDGASGITSFSLPEEGTLEGA